MDSAGINFWDALIGPLQISAGTLCTANADIPELIARVDISNECLLVRERAMVSEGKFETR